MARVLFAALALTATSAYSASKTVLVLGDSISAEYGLQRGAGWVALLEKRLRDKGLETAIVNASISGETTSGGRARVQTLLDKHRPAVMIIELGGNDGLRGLSLAASESNLRAMISVAKKTGAKVLLVGMKIPPNYGRDYTERFFNMYARLAKETRSGLVPFMFEGLAEKPELFQPDRIHPAAAAQGIMLDNVWPHLAPLLK